MRYTSALALLLLFTLACFSCKRKTNKETVHETRTSGNTTILVDETYSRILDDQVMVFESDYPDAKVKSIIGNESEILPKFIKGEVKMIVLSRMLKPAELGFYKQRQSAVYTDRFAIDGLALIVINSEVDSTITVRCT